MIVGFRTYTNQYAPVVCDKRKKSIKSIEIEKTSNPRNVVEICNVDAAASSFLVQILWMLCE